MSSGKHRPTGAAFLLAQLGAHAAGRFADRIAHLGITPAHAGILRFIARTPGLNQQRLAKFLGVLPSRMVLLIDELAARGLVQRRRSTKDRRHSKLVLTKKGERTLRRLSKIVVAHEADLCGALTREERDTLARLGRKIVQHQGLTPDVHPAIGIYSRVARHRSLVTRRSPVTPSCRGVASAKVEAARQAGHFL